MLAFLLCSTTLLQVSACQFPVRAFRDCNSLGLVTLRLAKSLQTADGSLLPSRNKRSVVQVLCTCLCIVASCLHAPLCCSCSHTAASVSVAWCKTFHERSLCLLRRVLVKSSRRTQLLERDTTATTQLCSADLSFPAHPLLGIIP